MMSRLSLFVLSLVALLNGRAWCAEPLTLLPSEFVLSGSEARQRLLVQAMAGTQVVGQAVGFRRRDRNGGSIHPQGPRDLPSSQLRRSARLADKA